MITFHVRRHHVNPDAQVVEIRSDGQIIAALAAHEDESSVWLLSKYTMLVTTVEPSPNIDGAIFVQIELPKCCSCGCRSA